MNPKSKTFRQILERLGERDLRDPYYSRRHFGESDLYGPRPNNRTPSRGSPAPAQSYQNYP